MAWSGLISPVMKFIRNKWVLVVLATAWRCVICQSVLMLSGWQAGYLSMLLLISPALQFSSWQVCVHAWDVLRAVSWPYTEHCYLQLQHSSHQQAHWTGALLPGGLTWTDSFRATQEFSLLLVLRVLGKLLHSMLSFTLALLRNPCEWGEPRKAYTE